MSNWSRDLRLAARTLLRKPFFSAVTIACLAVGIGASSTVFSVVRGVLLKALPYADSARLVVLWNHFPSSEPSRLAASEAELLDLRERAETLDVAGVMGWRFVLTGTEEVEQVIGAKVSANFFQVLGQEMLRGRAFEVGEDESEGELVVVLSHGLWQRQFAADPTLLGQPVTLNGKAHTVVGILPADFNYNEQMFQVFTPMRIHREWMLPRDARAVGLLGRLAPGSSLAQARSELESLAQSFREENPDFYPANSGWQLRLRSLFEETVEDARPTLGLMQAAGLLVLFLACGNASQMLLARALERRPEMALRMALGAGRAGLLRGVLAEALWLSAAGGVLGLLLAGLGIRWLVRSPTVGVPRLEEVQIDGSVVAFTLGVALLAGLLIGIWSALRVWRHDLMSWLRPGGQRTGASGTNRGALVVSEVAIALIVLIAAGLLVESLRRLQRVDPGFRHDDLLTLQLYLPRTDYRKLSQTVTFFEQLLEELEGLPGVTDAAVVSDLPLSGMEMSGSILIEGQTPPGEKGPTVGWRTISPGYFKTLGIPIKAGRPFDRRDDAEGAGTVIIDEGMARRFWPDRDAVGQRLALGDWAESDELTVVGVVGEVLHREIDGIPTEQLYLPLAQHPNRSMAVALRTSGDPMVLAGSVRRLVKDLDAEMPVVEMSTMAQRVTDASSGFRWNAQTFTALAILALTLTVLGVFGLTSYSVTRRTSEIGLRMALGSRKVDVLSLILGQSLKRVLLGVAVGLVGAVAVSRGLQGLLYGVEPTDPWVFAAAVLLLVPLALAGCLHPAWRASRLNPLIALRRE